MAKKLKRDLVVSWLDNGDQRVGVYFEEENKLLFELTPADADLLIKIWNGLVEKYKQPRLNN